MTAPGRIRLHLVTGALLVLAAAGGILASFTPMPLPYMLGSLLATGAVAIALPHRLPEDYVYPPALRTLFIAAIGLMIGGQIDRALFEAVPRMALSLGAVLVFVLAAQGINYLIFRRIGGFDRPTAIFAGAPGGLIESITLGEEAGADLRPLMVQQFLRIIMVVTLLPLALSLWMGHPVGSAAGISLSPGAMTLSDWPLLLATGAAGLGLGRLLRLPAWQLTGAMLAAALVNLSGLAALNVPQWLVNVAQVVVGASLGLRFVGISRALLLRGLGLSVLSVGAMLLLGAGLALAIGPASGQPFDVLIITFAPGGVTEMGLVALSLSANPAFVALHHIFRITITVVGVGLIARRLRA